MSGNEQLVEAFMKAIRRTTFVECEALIVALMDVEWELTCDTETDTYKAYREVKTAIRAAATQP